MTRYTAKELKGLTVKCAGCGKTFTPKGRHKHAKNRYCSNRCRLAKQRVQGFPQFTFERQLPPRRHVS